MEPVDPRNEPTKDRRMFESPFSDEPSEWRRGGWCAPVKCYRLECSGRSFLGVEDKKDGPLLLPSFCSPRYNVTIIVDERSDNVTTLGNIVSPEYCKCLQYSYNCDWFLLSGLTLYFKSF